MKFLEGPLEHPYVLQDQPLFVPSHQVQCCTLGERRLRTKTESDSIHTEHNIFRVKRDTAEPFNSCVDGKQHALRIMSEEYESQLQLLDNQICTLRTQRRELLAEAMRHGRAVKVGDCRQRTGQPDGSE